ncbi:MAG: PilZ domain-containing protein [Leptospiraceae bacterium]|nr:PilZ domain-containing protein [Leptospiraceae bacterium]MCP5497657.1 PilZ domain-containing protein [Leptospiraceae bacterium]
MKKIFPVSFSNLPIPLLLIGTFFVIVPIISYFATANEIRVSPVDYMAIFKSFSLKNYALNLLAVVVGLGLLSVKRWAYIVFLIFNGLLILDGLYLLFKYGTTVKFLGNMFITLFAFFFILYFLNKEISTPYLTLIPRGFRKKWRIAIPLKGILTDNLGNQISFTTIDVSPGGCFAKIEGNIQGEDEYNLNLEIDSPWQVKAKVVRINGQNIGLKFMYFGVSDPLKKELKDFLESKLLPRYNIKVNAIIKHESKEYNCLVLNISKSGCFLATETKIPKNEKVDYSYKLFGLNFHGIGRISWINEEGSYHKPKGMGIAYESINNRLVYSLVIRIIMYFYSTDIRER